MSRDFLSHVIRSYGGPLHGMIGSYLEQSVKLFVSQQREMRERKGSGSLDSSALATLVNRNYERWRSVQDEIYSTLAKAAQRQ
jgi:polyhydroxyalkanoate synthesis regulator protein